MSETSICNQALASIGANRINNLTDGTVNAIHCTTHYAQTRDALLRSHWWRFATARAVLSENIESPDFEWDYQFDLPVDFLRLISIYDDNGTIRKNVYRSFAIEGNMILINDDSVNLKVGN